MSDLPPHVKAKWKAVERKAQLPGATFRGLLNDIGDAVDAYVDWLLGVRSVQQLAQSDNGENRQSETVEDDSYSEAPNRDSFL